MVVVVVSCCSVSRVLVGERDGRVDIYERST